MGVAMSKLKIDLQDLIQMLTADSDTKIPISRKAYLGKELADGLEPGTEYYLYGARNNETGGFYCVTADKQQVDDDPDFEGKVISRIKFKLGGE